MKYQDQTSRMESRSREPLSQAMENDQEIITEQISTEEPKENVKNSMSAAGVSLDSLLTFCSMIISWTLTAPSLAWLGDSSIDLDSILEV